MAAEFREIFEMSCEKECGLFWTRPAGSGGMIPRD